MIRLEQFFLWAFLPFQPLVIQMCLMIILMTLSRKVDKSAIFHEYLVLISISDGGYLTKYGYQGVSAGWREIKRSSWFN